jgi:hypothetical protein
MSRTKRRQKDFSGYLDFAEPSNPFHHAFLMDSTKKCFSFLQVARLLKLPEDL